MEIEVSTNILNDLMGVKNRIILPQKSVMPVREFLDFLAGKYGENIPGRLLENGDLRPEIIFLLNGQNIDSLNGLETAIHDGDHLVVITAMVGG